MIINHNINTPALCMCFLAGSSKYVPKYSIISQISANISTNIPILMNITTEKLRQELKEFFGFSNFKELQEDIIKHLIRGNNAFVLMPTGGGKSLCYQLPALLMEGTAIVVSPLIALMKNQVDAIRGFVAEKEGIAHFL